MVGVQLFRIEASVFVKTPNAGSYPGKENIHIRGS
jgi:hypothetical protein